MSDAEAGLINSAVVGIGYAAPGEEPEVDPPPVEPGPFDPADHTVAEVEEYIAAHPDEQAAVLQAEAAGKARTTLVGSGGTS